MQEKLAALTKGPQINFTVFTTDDRNIDNYLKGVQAASGIEMKDIEEKEGGAVNVDVVPETDQKLNQVLDETKTVGQDKELTTFDKDVMQFYFKQALITNQSFRFLMLFSAFLSSLALGSNDVSNAISPLILLMRKAGKPAYASFLIGALGLTAGLAIFGHRVINTVGK